MFGFERPLNLVFFTLSLIALLTIAETTIARLNIVYNSLDSTS